MAESSSSHFHFYRESLSLLTDLYQLTMSQGYWKAGLDRKEAVYHLFFRKNPFHGGYGITAGLESAINFIKNFHYAPDDLAYLATLQGADGKCLFESAFLDYLAQMRFSCDIDAIPEGTIVFPYEPLIRVQGPLIQCQLLESPLLNLINFPTLIATKAARICHAAERDPVCEFGLRRAQGIDGSLTASRAAYIGGCSSTSNVMAGKLFGIPLKGTHSHSWVMLFANELEAFKTYAEEQPDNCIFLVDTYDTLEGVKKAIEVAQWLANRGKKMAGIRLDSGDLAYLSIKSRALLDAAGLEDVIIVASNDLDETIISELKRQGARIDVWGVGTNLVTAGAQPALDGVYKLSAIRDPDGDWVYKLKLSEQMTKISNPGILQVRRFVDTHGQYVADAIYDVMLGIKQSSAIIDPLDVTRQKILKSDWTGEDLLVPIFRKGHCLYSLPQLNEIQMKVKKEMACLHDGIKRFLYPHPYVVGMEKLLYHLKLDLIKKIRGIKQDR